MADEQTSLDDLAMLDAAGALDEPQRLDLRARLAAATAGERAAVAELYELAAQTAVDAAADARAPMPPPGLRDRLMTRVKESQMFWIRATEGAWTQAPIPGITVKLLSLDRTRNTAMILMRAEPGTRYPAHHHTGAEDCYVISGDVVAGGKHLYAGDFHHAAADSDHEPLYTEHGAELLLVVGAEDYL